MKEAVMIRKPEYYTSFNEGDVITLLREVGYNSHRGEMEYQFRHEDGTEQYIMESDIRWIDESATTRGDTYEQDTKDCRIAELEAEVAELKEQLAAAKTLLKGAL